MLAQLIGIRLIELPQSIFDILQFTSNPPDRCYYCKKALFSLMLEKAKANGIHVLLDGSNRDDDNDYRPGTRALEKLNIKSPLKDLGFTKVEIRTMSKELGLPTWDKQSFACLASRFPTPQLLERTWKSEAVLSDFGIKHYRVRNHGDTARIEVDAEDVNLLLNKAIKRKVVAHLKSFCYMYVTLDLHGYRTGSMNEVLNYR